MDYFAYHETFAVLVAGLGHDLGHPGVNGRFLIETKHPLAMTYNDRRGSEIPEVRVRGAEVQGVVPEVFWGGLGVWLGMLKGDSKGRRGRRR